MRHVSTGDLFREHLDHGTLLGQHDRARLRAGLLVSDEVTIRVIQERLKRADTRGGFPRSLAQAKALDGTLAASQSRLDAVLGLEIAETEVVRRIAGRRLCRNEPAHIFHTDFSPPDVPGLCDICGGELYQRPDDSEATVRQRLEVYRSETAPVLDHYQAQGIATMISALGQVTEVLNRALLALDKDRAGAPGGENH
ncbi:adenylate kinase family protein [Streptomyces zhihengii]